MDIEEILSEATHDDAHIFVADVSKSLDALDRGIWDCALRGVFSLSMAFILALSVPWCGYLSCQEGVAPHLYADNMNCTTTVEDALLRAVRFSDLYIRAVWQEASQVWPLGDARRVGPSLLGRQTGHSGPGRVFGCRAQRAGWYLVQRCVSGYLSGACGWCICPCMSCDWAGSYGQCFATWVSGWLA